MFSERALFRAARSLLHTPIVTAVCVISLGAAFSVNVLSAAIVRGVLLQGLPFPQSSSLVSVELVADGPWPLSYPDARDMENGTHSSLAGLTVFAEDQEIFNRGGRSEVLNGRVVDAAYFSVLRSTPLIGRLLTQADLGKHDVVISYDLWKNRFGSSPLAVGALLTFSNVPYRVVGVANKDQQDPAPEGLSRGTYWVPADPRDLNNYARGDFNFDAIARVAPGISLAQARADITRAFDSVRHADLLDHANIRGVIVTPLLERIVGRVAGLIWLVYAAVTLVVIIACANVAHLILMRYVRREGEFATRRALGATISNLVGKLAAESLVLTIAGAVLGVAGASAALLIVSPYCERFLPRSQDVTIDLYSLLYVCGLIIASAAFTTVLPAFRVRRDLTGRLNETRASLFRSTKRTLALLVFAEIALATALVVFAVTITSTFESTIHEPVGFSPSDSYVLTVRGLFGSRYGTLAANKEFFRQLNENLMALPGVSDVAIAAALPFINQHSTNVVVVPSQNKVRAGIDMVSPRFMRTLDVPFVRGREFTDDDGPASRPIAIVSAGFATRVFGTLDVVGRKIIPQQWDESTKVPPIRTIVGVVRDLKTRFSEPAVDMVYVPLAQDYSPNFIVVRATPALVDPPSAFAKAVFAIDSQLPEPDVESYVDVVNDTVIKLRFTALVFSLFAITAALLSIVGVFATVSYSVEQQRRDFAIRRALGASRGRVVVAVVASIGRTSLFACLLGFIAAYVLVPPAISLLEGAQSSFSITLAIFTAAVFFCVTTLAALWPTHRAVPLIPADVLKYE